MNYLWLKYIHIVSSTILFGTGIGTAAVMLYGYYRKNLQAMVIINQYVVFVDWIFTGTSGFIQPVSGLWMVYLAGFSFKSRWIMGSLLGYSVAGLCWFFVVYLQIKIRNLSMDALKTGQPLPSSYAVYFKYWMGLGFIAFSSLLLVFYLMVMKPAI
jgi:uncharacterized membrane protein